MGVVHYFSVAMIKNTMTWSHLRRGFVFIACLFVWGWFGFQWAKVCWEHSSKTWEQEADRPHLNCVLTQEVEGVKFWPCPDPVLFSVQQSSTSYRFPANWGPSVQTHEPLGDIFSFKPEHMPSQILPVTRGWWHQHLQQDHDLFLYIPCRRQAYSWLQIRMPHITHFPWSLNIWRCWNVPRASKSSQTLAYVGKNQQSALSQQRQVKAWN